MGGVASRAIRARRRDTIAEIERLVAARDEPKTTRRSQRIKAAKRDGRRALRARNAAQEASVAAEVTAGTALRRLADQGLSMGDAAVLLDVSRSAAKRLVRIANDATATDEPEPSTETSTGRDTAAASAHGETGSTAARGAIPERNL